MKIEAPELEDGIWTAVCEAIRIRCAEPNEIEISSLACDVLAAIRHAGYSIWKEQTK
jgi:hypothetical protein